MTTTSDEPTLSRPGLLHRPDFRRLWIGETTSALGSSVSSVALPLVAVGVLHASVFAISVLSGLVWVPWLVVGLPAGAWVDRLPRRAVMMTCDIASFVALVSVPIAVWTGSLSLSWLFVVAIVVGVAEVFFSTAYRVFLPAMLAADELVDGNARLQGAESAAQVAGPGVAGLLAQAVGAATGVLLDALSFLVSLSCLRGLRIREQRIAREHRTLRSEVVEGLRFVGRDPLLRSLMFYGGAANLVLSGVGAIEVVFLVRGLDESAGVAGLLIAVGQVGGVVGALLAPRVAAALGSARTLLVVKLVTVPVALLIPLTAPGGRLLLFAVGSSVLVAGVTAGNVVQRGFTQAYVPTELMGRVNTSTQVVNFGLIPVGAVLGGGLAGTIGFRLTLLTMLIGLLAASLALLAGPLRGMRELPSRSRG